MRLKPFSFLLGLISTLVISTSPVALYASPPNESLKPFGLPFATAPGPSTWLLGQPYGNTLTAYRWRRSTYGAGQGLHFGIDLSAPCRTEVVAVGDGIVAKVDATNHGAGPHNLMINHADGYASFYGHLIERPRLEIGQAVTQGQVIALTGDPDLTCQSRPHLHLEFRDSQTYTHAFNPVALIEANWEALAVAMPFGRGFARDLNNPRQWQYLDDQPNVDFWQPLLNDYAQAWPLEWND